MVFFNLSEITDESDQCKISKRRANRTVGFAAALLPLSPRRFSPAVSREESAPFRDARKSRANRGRSAARSGCHNNPRRPLTGKAAAISSAHEPGALVFL
jgi:hypothetical protein